MASVTRRPACAVDERRFFLAMSILMLATVFAGFARSFFLRAWFPDHPAPADPWLAFAAWAVNLVY